MLKISDFTIGYNEKVIVKDFNLHVKKGEMLTIIGPNGSGKSTVLKAVGRLLKPMNGVVYLDGKLLLEMSNKEISKEMACLSQHNSAPKDMTIRKIVSFGRNPHKNWFESLNKKDEDIITWAIEKTNLTHMENKNISDISGGERQRAWIAMALAQNPKVLLLDEPTTYLDINNQIEILELVKELNKKLNLTVVMVLHDLNQAAKYSTEVLVLKDGTIKAQGKPEKILDKELIRSVYNVDMDILKNQFGEKVIFIPKQVYKENKM
ncbi:ABC transporter ATP-binding protein [Clostridium botulinum]|uniref:Iron ABC transporter ATP-binding protein n=1 Tax=Clostridium botulinum C/D str. DC5 TaxID=1443128 RepID=A0A0A0IIA5_CLOBO|nr:ABC transporter ATP-binding protein [Clostridium botulinum]KEI07474.1 iron ABC transporter ATP-binding protein [Clostridium botulinum C/D str. BKT75002]KEI09842.1 iron ABC transporter ATP-binding protein [Clostridium botulinum C/D str. BKT2873]KGM97630.1 iron ABC transporter ATP-binding protein [Clostridium botulinum D str. CCUG 7971]KGN00688.1 iron ABC transporter ATP-binding protein [Clostridium botulinum C/D str. DC5]KOC51032.1 iron ABC transporter ATP-binding protein [Clostridium botuli